MLKWLRNKVLTGAAYTIPPDRVNDASGVATLTKIPIGDWPILIADAAALPAYTK